MRFSVVFYLLGRLFCIIGIFVLVPAAASYYYREIPVVYSFLITAGVMFAVGVGLMIWNRAAKEMPIAVRDGFLLVTLSWLCVSALGSIPYVLTGVFPSFVDALFESISGFTTTGATVLADIEAVPRGILLWRSFTQWIGGLGIIVLAVAILPQLSVGGMQLMKNEMPGPTFEQLKPRIKQTALSLWKTYVFFSVLLVLILVLMGMPLFDGLCHAFSTLGSGGFSTQNQSLGAYSPAIQMVVTLFMFLAGVNFVLHYAWLHGDFRKLFLNPELRFFTIFIISATTFIIGDLVIRTSAPLGDSLRVALFQVVSIATSTGFTTADFDAWPFFSKGILFLLMFVGGCAGSTAGGFKQVRLQLLLLKARSTLMKQIFPKAVLSVRLGKKQVSEDVIDGVSNLFLVSVVILAACTLVLLAFNIEFVTATSAVVACLSNIGPGLGFVGPSVNYAWLPDTVKIILSICMIVGRLEFFTVLVLLLPVAWKR